MTGRALGNRTATLDPGLQALAEGRHADPFRLLGYHEEGSRSVVRAIHPAAERVWLADTGDALERVPGTDLFELWDGPTDLPSHYRLAWETKDGAQVEGIDPYTFGARIQDFDLHLFGEGRHWHAYRFLGAHPEEVDGIAGTTFAVWAPNAERASVVGEFNHWDGRTHPMRIREGTGVWELFIPGVGPGTFYKFELRTREEGHLRIKADPYCQAFERPPGNASIVPQADTYSWGDDAWLTERAERDWYHAPMAIYEVHLGSWQRADDGSFLNYRDLAHRLVDYVTRMGYTHIELMPVTEHPLDASWGYQTTGFFAPTCRFGSPEDFRYFVDYCHQNGIGVLLDWVPGHFPKDDFALARFDGTALYEHEDPRLGEHREWGTLIFNYGRPEVHNFLLSAALYWIEELHIDGLRVDAVASMLYLDYGREDEDWIPNKYGGRENLEAIEFLQAVNRVVQEQNPGALMIAEESTSWPQVTRPPYLGGLGFAMKWNMGWMNDTLEYIAHDPVFRHYQHDHLTFGLVYAFTENFVLPLSHDEVVHGKTSMLGKMPGDDWQKFANLRLLYTFMYAYPGKKLQFMGNELAQWHEWSEEGPLDWPVLDNARHAAVQQLTADLNQLHRSEPALHQHDFEGKGFEWIDCHDAPQSTLAFLRWGDGRPVVVVLNFTPVPREQFRIGVPEAGLYREILNTDATGYGGSGVGNGGGIEAEPVAWMGRPYSVALTLPPLAGVILQPDA